MDYSKAKELLKLQQEASKIQNELSNIHIEAEVNWVVITVNWKMEVVNVVIEDKSILNDATKLENAIKDATNKWFKKAQEIAADKMKDVMWGLWMNFPWM